MSDERRADHRSGGFGGLGGLGGGSEVELRFFAQEGRFREFMPEQEGHFLRSEGDCSVRQERVYDARGYSFPAAVKLCPESPPVDVTVGTFAPRPGDQLFLSTGRAMQAGRGFLRGRPNVPYPILFGERDVEEVLGMARNNGTASWSRLARALPFLPGTVYRLTNEQRYIFYAYGDLIFLPSRRREAVPLNSQSIIISINGIGFLEANAIFSVLHDWMPVDEQPFLEIVYFQRDETPVVPRRAFIPQYFRRAIEPEWSSIAAANRTTRAIEAGTASRDARPLW